MHCHSMSKRLRTIDIIALNGSYMMSQQLHACSLHVFHLI